MKMYSMYFLPVLNGMIVDSQGSAWPSAPPRSPCWRRGPPPPAWSPARPRSSGTPCPTGGVGRGAWRDPVAKYSIAKSYCVCQVLTATTLLCKSCWLATTPLLQRDYTMYSNRSSVIRSYCCTRHIVIVGLFKHDICVFCLSTDSTRVWPVSGILPNSVPEHWRTVLVWRHCMRPTL